MDYAIIVAGGKGLRMGAEIPKQFLPVNGLPVIMHTIRRFREYDKDIGIILVLPEEQTGYWRGLCEKYRFDERYETARGGDTRFGSVKNALDKIPDDACGVAGVHDGVRPFVSTDVIKRCFTAAKTLKAVIPAVAVTDTLRRITDQPGGMTPCNTRTTGGNKEFKPEETDTETVPRDRYMLVQTPQTFDIKLLKRAYTQPYTPAFTDDASVVERLGHKITVIPGNRENIKITTPFDLKVAEALSSV